MRHYIYLSIYTFGESSNHQYPPAPADASGKKKKKKKKKGAGYMHPSVQCASGRDWRCMLSCNSP